MVYRVYLGQAMVCRHCGKEIAAGTSAHRISREGNGPDGRCVFVHPQCSAPWEKYQRELLEHRMRQGREQEKQAQGRTQGQEKQMVMNMVGMAGNEYGRR